MPFKLKQILYWFLYRLDVRLPKRIGPWLRNRCFPWRPVLDAVELDMVDRCNLNCTACSHFSPFAQPGEADAAAAARDLAALRAKFRGGIRHVNLLGGEPLLHSDPCGFLRAVRAAVPEAVITLVTNGLVFTRSDLFDAEAFLRACAACRVRVKWSLYPPLQAHRAEIAARFRAAGVSLRVEEAGAFWARTVPEGTADPRRSFRFCRERTYCPYLRDGRLYPCAQAFHFRDYDRACRAAGLPGLAGAAATLGLTGDPARAGLDIRGACTAAEILAFLHTPSPICRYCADSYRVLPWSQGSRDPRAWQRHGG